jgi:hypothetical protein
MGVALPVTTLSPQTKGEVKAVKPLLPQPGGIEAAK